QTTVRIFTPVIGQVTAIRADIGQPVSAGTPLADISSPDYGQALADAQTATGNLAAAQKAFLRAKDLLEHGAAAAKDVEAAEAAFVAARAERDRAESRLKLYGGSETETGEAFVLRSPVAGVVVERNINPGQEVRNDQMLANAPNLFAPLFVVSDPALLWIQLDVSESDLPSLEPGLALRIHARAFPDRVFDGAVEKVGEEMDPSTRTVIVRGVVRNPDKLLKAEMYVLADVVQDESRVAKAGVEISSKAIFMVDNRNYLFVEVGPGQYERRQVSIGTEKDGRVPVLDGLSAGQKVVTEGGLLLQSILDPAD
ncbi:MAG: efflux RND transporter periplasmic adaptor subunit, partial [Opitutaceae bacterium]